jgi:mono/diheme cytochrome c family protein
MRQEVPMRCRSGLVVALGLVACGDKPDEDDGDTGAEDGWAAAAYIWNDAGDDALKQMLTEENVSGTPHDVPGAAECQACHGGRRNFTLGFSATQIDGETRAELFADGVLSDPVEAELDLPDKAREGLGYLHGNCSHCHNATREEQAQATECYSIWENFDLSLPPGLSKVKGAPAVKTAGERLWDGGESVVLERMAERNTDLEQPSMPPLGTELVDDEGLATVRAFVETL